MSLEQATSIRRLRVSGCLVRQQAVRLYVDGLNFRRIARTLGVNPQSVINWVNAYAEQVPDTLPTPEETVKVAELDELFTFVGRKKRRLCCHRR